MAMTSLPSRRPGTKKTRRKFSMKNTGPRIVKGRSSERR